MTPEQFQQVIEGAGSIDCRYEAVSTAQQTLAMGGTAALIILAIFLGIAAVIFACSRIS